MNKEQLTYFVSKSTEDGFSWVVTAQRGSKEREINTRFVNYDSLNEAIGLATRLAISAKEDYGNPKVRLVIEAAICSVVDPMIKL